MNDFQVWFRKCQMLAKYLLDIELESQKLIFHDLYEKEFTPRQAVEAFTQDFL